MTTKRNRNNFIEVNVLFKQSKKLRIVRFINIFTFFKKIVGKVLGKMTHITACLAIMNMNSTCFFLTYQPDVPEE